MRNTLETRLGIFFLLALLAAFFILETIGGLGFLRPGYRVHGLFENVQELRIGDPVRMGGVEIGRVDDIEISDANVRVTMRIDRDREVRTDSTARIRFTGLMGQNYISLDFGTPDGVAAVDGTYLPTLDQPDLSQLMARLDNVAVGVENLTKTFTGEELTNLLGPFTDFLEQNRPHLSAMLANLNSISTEIAEGRGTVGRVVMDDELYVSTLGLVDSLDEASDELMTTLSDTRALLGQAQEVMDGVQEGRGTIGKLLTDETLHEETALAMAHLRDILEKISMGQGAVGELVNDDTFLRQARMSLQKLDKATEGLEDQGPLSILGIAVNSLF